MIQNIDLCGTTCNASGFSIWARRNLHVACLMLCIFTWQTSTQSYNNPAAFLGKLCKWYIHRNMLFKPVDSGCIVNIKILFEMIAALHGEIGRLYMFAVFCQHLEVTLRHLQCCKQETLLQMSWWRSFYITSWSYWSACPVYSAAQCQPLWGSLTTHTLSGLSPRPAILDSNSTVHCTQVCNQFLPVDTLTQVLT